LLFVHMLCILFCVLCFCTVSPRLHSCSFSICVQFYRPPSPDGTLWRLRISICVQFYRPLSPDGTLWRLRKVLFYPKSHSLITDISQFWTKQRLKIIWQYTHYPRTYQFTAVFAIRRLQHTATAREENSGTMLYCDWQLQFVFMWNWHQPLPHRPDWMMHTGPAFRWCERGPCPGRWLRGGAKKAVTDRPHVNT
jgi:hypothetical protein